MSTTAEQVWNRDRRTEQRPVVPQASCPATCGCGQDLDRCSAGHCPRCGTQLGSFRVEPTGFWAA